MKKKVSDNTKFIIIVSVAAAVVFFTIFFISLNIVADNTAPSVSQTDEAFPGDGQMYDENGSPIQEEQQPQEEDVRLLTDSSNAQDNSEDYINDALYHDVYVTWKRMPISIYVEGGQYKNTVIRAFNEYANALKGIISFTNADTTSNANIVVRFVGQLPTTSEERYIRAYTDNNYSRASADTAHLTKSNIRILVNDPSTGNPLSVDAIYPAALHSIGHALGIIGHSKNSNDIMYEQTAGQSGLSSRDISTLLKLYNRAPKAAPQQTTVQEQSQPPHRQNPPAPQAAPQVDSPNNPNTWIKLGDNYANLKKTNEAIEAYNEALKLDKTKSALINHKIGTAYVNNGDYSQAEQYLKNAIDAQPGNKEFVYTYLNGCIKLNKKAEAAAAIDRYHSVNPDAKDGIIDQTAEWAKN